MDDDFDDAPGDLLSLETIHMIENLMRYENEKHVIFRNRMVSRV